MPGSPEAGVLVEPYTQLSQLSGVAIPVPAFVDWRACTATPLSGLS
jgi:hypothetical protein